LAFTLLSIFTVFFGVFSALIKERFYAGEAIIATVVGIALSEYGAGLFAPNSWGGGEGIDEITLEITRVVIALAVFAIGEDHPKLYAY